MFPLLPINTVVFHSLLPTDAVRVAYRSLKQSAVPPEKLIPEKVFLSKASEIFRIAKYYTITNNFFGDELLCEGLAKNCGGEY